MSPEPEKPGSEIPREKMKTEVSAIPLDMVFTYVDGNDPDYVSSRIHFRKDYSDSFQGVGASDSGDRDIRFQNVGEITYSINSVLKHLPWIRTVFLVTETKKPPLAAHLLASGRVRIVHPSEFIPSRYLPSFSSNVIESFLYRIEGISEIFLYNNDDYMHFSPVARDFFYSMGEGALALELHAYPAFYRWALCRIARLSGRYRSNLHTFMIANAYEMLRNPRFGFSPRDILVPVHATKLWRKSVALRVEEEFGSMLEESRLRKFRNASDVSYYTILYSMEYKLNPQDRLHWHLLGSMNSPNDMFDFSAISIFGDKQMLWRRIRQSHARLACLNDIPFCERDRFVEVMKEKGLAELDENSPLAPCVDGSNFVKGGR